MPITRHHRPLTTALAWVAALSLPLAFSPACGPRKPAAEAQPEASTSSSVPPEDRPKSDNVTAEAPPPPPPAATPTATPPGASEDFRKAYEQGFAQYLRGDLAGAQQSFQSALSIDSKGYVAHYAIGLVFEHLGKNADALDHYREAYKLNANYEAAVTAYGYLLYRMGSTTESESFLTEQNTKAPKAFGIMTALAEIKSLKGDSSTAQSLAQNALTLEGKYEPAMVLIARDHFRAGRTGLAQYVLAAILDGQQTEEERSKGEPAKKNPPRAPGNAEAQILRAIIFQRAGDRTNAGVWFEKAAKSRPDLVEAHFQLGLLRIESNDAEGARVPLETAVRFAPANAEARLALGEAYRLQALSTFDGKLGWERAKAEYNWVLAAPKASALVKALAQYDLGLLYFLVPGVDNLQDVPRLDKAIDYFRQYQASKGTSQGASWPNDADDLLAQAQTSRRNAEAAAKGAGGTTPKGTAAPTATTPPKPTATTPPKPTATTPPAASTTAAPKPTTTAPAASTTAAPKPTTTAAPTASTTAKPAAPTASTTSAPTPTSSAPKTKDTF
jgi:Tfp pilus assembly protein PilF